MTYHLIKGLALTFTKMICDTCNKKKTWKSLENRSDTTCLLCKGLRRCPRCVEIKKVDVMTLVDS